MPRRPAALVPPPETQPDAPVPQNDHQPDAPATEPEEELTLEAYEERRLALVAKLPPVADRPKTLYGKLALVTGLIGQVRKSGRNTFHNYNYAKESDLVEAIRPLLAELGIWVWWSLYSDPEKGFKHHERLSQMKKDDRVGNYEVNSLTAITGIFKFVDGDSNATEPQILMGYGDDAGDKGLYKAYTGMEKYFLFKSFLVSTGDDPERDTNTDRRAAQRDATSVEVRGRGSRGAPPSGDAPPPQDVPEGGRRPTGPGGHQRGQTAPQASQLRTLLVQMGIKQTVEAIPLIERILGTTIPVDGEDPAGSLASFLGALSSQDMGKLIHDIRKVVETAAPGSEAQGAQVTGDQGASADSSTLGAGVDQVGAPDGVLTGDVV